MSPGNVLARDWWIVILAAVVIAAATYEISKRIPARYSSSATAAVQVSGSDPNATTQAADNLASQYAQQVGAQPVLAASSRILHESQGALAAAVSGGVVGAQNLISIQANGTSPQQAQRRAAVVTGAFIRYIARQVTAQSKAYDANSTQQLAPLNDQIAKVTKEIGGFSARQQASSRYLSLQQSESTLLAERAVALANIAQTGVGGHPSISLVNYAGLGGQTAPKPKLYAIVAFVLGLLIVARLVVFFAPRKRASR
jgi:capsular polysaccharide biosynthesis protein